MESLHDPNSRKWISKKINLKKYFDELMLEVEEMRPNKNVAEKINSYKLSQMIGIKYQSPRESKLILKQIEEATSLDLLNLDDDDDDEDPAHSKTLASKNKSDFKKYKSLPIPKNASNSLKTLYYQELYLNKSRNNNCLQQRRKNVLIDCNNTWFECRHDDPDKLNLRLFHNELLVVVRIYRPIKYDTHRHSLLDRTRYTQELYLLGKNKLSELRDHIKCALDHSVSADLSHYPNESKSVKNGKELYKSGFLFINDCFYNDMRWPDCIDYSEVILNWANQPGRKLGKFTKAIMEDTYIRDLDIRLGYPYVYVHHGEHEHLFSFVDARLVSANDPQEVSNYPYERSVGIRNGKNCMICSMFVAKWITTENDRVPEDPFYFCEDCFHNFNYGKDGSKIGNFKAYKYVDNNAL